MKAIRQAQTRAILDAYNIEDISYSRMNEMFNELADEFAIDFLKWVVSPETRDLLSDLEIVGEIDQFVTPEQLLEIYKKEKGL